METERGNKSSADLITGPATNLGELHHTSPMTEQGHGGTIHSHLETHPSTLSNNPASPSSLSSSLNPFLLPNDATNNAGNGCMMNYGSSSTGPSGSLWETHHSSTVGMVGSHLSFEPSAHESSQGNPFLGPNNTDNEDPLGAFESRQNQPFAYKTVPTNVESHNAFPVIERGHQSMASRNLETPFSSAFESSSQEPIQVSVNGSSKSQTDTHQPSTYETVPTNVESHNAFPVIKQGHHSMASSNLETLFSSASESSSQEPIQVSVNASSKSQTDTHQPSVYETVPKNMESHNAFTVIEQGHQSKASSDLEAPFSSAFESSIQEPIQASVNATSKSQIDNHKPSTHETVPQKVESHSAFLVIEQGHQSIASSNLEAPFSSASESSSQKPIQVSVNSNNRSLTDTHVSPILEVDSKKAAESNDDVPISSMPKHGQSGNVAGQYSPAVAPSSDEEFCTNKGSEIQNPPVQKMERSGDSDIPYVFPSHVFARNNTNAPVEWSTNSNESLFSIYMGNTSFGGELAYFNKSNDLDKPSDISMSDPPNASASHQPPAQVNKFNHISQKTAELHEEGHSVTEAKAAETMREVIMEACQTTKNDDKGEHKSSNSPYQSEKSTKSHAFQLSTDKGKSVSSGDDGEKQRQQKSVKQQETTNAIDQAPKPTTNAPPNRLLSCFACCTFCH